jgi:hypothetical protein
MAELIGLLGRVVERVFTALPSWLIAWKYPPKKVAEEFFILLAKPDGLPLYLQGAQSRSTLALTAVNLSPIWVEIEQIDVSI